MASHLFEILGRYTRRTHGRTCLNNALEYAMNTALSSERGGRRGESGVQQEIILVTDGCANCASGITASLQRTSDRLIAAGIHVYVVGIGLDSNCEQNLKILAQGGKCFHFFYLKQWDYKLDHFIQALEHPFEDRCLSSWGTPDGSCRR